MNNMRFVSSHLHGILDYIVGILLLITPEVFGFTQVGGAAVAVPRVIGGLILMQAILTRYELGMVKILPFSLHIGIDYLGGIFLAGSPILFGFNDQPANVWLPHIIVGAFIFFSTLFTDTQPDYSASDQPTSTTA